MIDIFSLTSFPGTYIDFVEEQSELEHVGVINYKLKYQQL